MIVRFDDCEMDLARAVLVRGGAEVPIEPQVFDLLVCLIEHRGELVRKEDLLDMVWGDRFVSESALTSRIKSARQAVGDDGTRQQVIRTAYGRGYEFIAAVEVIEAAGEADRPGTAEESGPAAGIGADRDDSITHDLPVSLNPLIGREELLVDLVEGLAANRLVTLVGASGVGKTSAGFELARRVVADYADGVFVVELVTVVDHDAALSAFATALDVNTRQRRSLEDAIVDMLRPRHALLVLDNCEHLVEQVGTLVDRILRAAPQVSIVATSREPLAVPGEQVFLVEPLRFAEATRADDGTADATTADASTDAIVDLAAVPAVALFVERARAADPRFELDESTGPAVVEICRRLDGIPLAIELAASRAAAIDVTELADRLDERFRLLKGVRRGTDPRHQTLHGAISWSYDLLDEDEKHLFASLAVFAGQFDLAAAESVCRGDDVLDLLTRLTRRSMLAVRRPAQGGIRYEMLETLREYGRSCLGDQESGELFTAHANQYAHVARSVEADLGTDREHDAVMRADGSFADLRAAQRFALEIEDYDAAFSLIASLREYAMRRMRYEVFTWADVAADLPGAADHPLSPVMTAIRAYGAWVRGEFLASQALAESVRAAESESGATATGLIGRVFANLAYATGRIEDGIVENARLIELAEEEQHDSHLAHAYYMASIAESSIGRYEEAERLIARSREAGSRTGSPTDLASSWTAQGFASHADDAAALDAFATADRLARSAGNRWMSAFARSESSALLVQRGDLRAGCEGLAATVDTWYRAGEWAQQWHTLSRCMVALDRIGHPKIAAQVLGAIEAHTTLGAPPVMVTLRDVEFETRDSLTRQLGAEQSATQQATGALLPVAAVVDRTRNALLGRDIEEVGG